jgi:hypothetical protein
MKKLLLFGLVITGTTFAQDPTPIPLTPPITIPNGWYGQVFCPPLPGPAPTPTPQPEPARPAPVEYPHVKYYCPTTDKFWPNVKECDVKWQIWHAKSE